MDQLGEKEEHTFQESSDHRCKRKDDEAAAAAATVAEGVHVESSTDQCDNGVYEAETARVIKEEQVEVVEEEASPPLLAHPCSLLQLLLLLRACAGCLLGLPHGYCSDNNDLKPQEGEGGDDDKAAAGSSEVATARRTPPPPPGPPKEGSGGHGGSHN